MNSFIAQSVAQSINDFPESIDRVIVIINGRIQYEYEDKSECPLLDCDDLTSDEINAFMI